MVNDIDNKIANLSALINDSDNIVFFGGAGVSTESGIPDFRSTDGLYNQKYDSPPETILSHSFFIRHTKEFYKFYRDKMLVKDALPNLAHKALVKLESTGKLKAIVTQNIDGLDTKAGTKNVFELHGSIYRNHCMDCGAFYGIDFIANSSLAVPLCTVCGGIVKPDVVLYEEALDDATVKGAVSAITAADLLIVGGTSLNVYPAAGMLHYYRGQNLVLINKTPTPFDSAASLVINESIGKVLGRVVL
jgi:NAD-dependent deacetylase